MTQVPPAALEIHAILERYVAIHETIFKFSWRKMLPIPGLFVPIDYGQHEKELAGLLRSLLHILEPSEGTRLSINLLEYGVALSNAIGSLLSICHNLYQKSQGSDRYDHVAYRAELAIYHAWVERYRALGTRLNRELA